MVSTDSILSVNCLVNWAFQKSVMVTLNCAEMGAVAVPVSTPVELKLNPEGNVPGVSDQVMGAVPPVIWMAAVYGTLMMPSGRGDALVMDGSALQATVSGPTLAVLATGWELSVTFSITLVELAVHCPTI